MFAPRTAAFQRGQWGLIASLVAVAIVVGLSAWYYAKTLAPAKGSHNGIPAAEESAYGVACTSYVQQMNQAADLYKQDAGKPPTNFNDLKKYGVTNDMLQTSGCQFQLDASTGTVTDIGKGQAAINAPPIVINGPASSSSPASNSGPMVLGGTAPAPSSTPSNNSTTVGAGGMRVNVPTGGGAEPTGSEGSE